MLKSPHQIDQHRSPKHMFENFPPRVEVGRDIFHMLIKIKYRVPGAWGTHVPCRRVAVASPGGAAGLPRAVLMGTTCFRSVQQQ